MADQYLSAFAVDADALLAVAGSGDDRLVRRALTAVGELREGGRLLRVAGPGEAEPVLRELVAGRLDPALPSRYTGVLELLGPVLGESLGSAVLPGRGWDGLAGAFRAWGLVNLAGLWGRPWPFPWREAAPGHDPWPFPVLAGRAELDLIHEELAGFDPGGIDAGSAVLPGGEDDVEEAEWLLAELLPAWVDGARGRGCELLLLRDGGR
ncbi:hypothetical protein OH807_28315 [Kitasatospora sp. NBC_01560]|uniref:DUF7691 family protein n=1 Tax=Kitasatospora sp. NBC_01560 TaxID=2975965 RepID=UPI00386CDECA